MKLRVFYGKECKRCALYLDLLKASDLDVEYLDADDIVNENLCDEENVDELPHTQIIDQNGKVRLNMYGIRSIAFLREYMSKILKSSDKKK